MNEKREQIRSKVFEASALMDAEERWMTNTIILADGASLAVDGGKLDNEDDGPIETLLNEAFELAGESNELYQFLVNEITMQGDAGNYGERRKERLGWKPGMTIGTPDIPQEKVDEYIGVTFHCPNCGDDE